MGPNSAPPITRALSRLDKSDGCWKWTGPVLATGYGRIMANGRMVYVHRLVYEHFIGPVPDGLELDHLCRVPACCNPLHLEPVTHRENIRRGFLARQGGLCHLGHEFDRVWGGKRYCSHCERLKYERAKRRRLAVTT